MTQDMNIPDKPVLLSLFMSSNYKYALLKSFSRFFDQYYIFETTQNEPIDKAFFMRPANQRRSLKNPLMSIFHSRQIVYERISLWRPRRLPFDYS